MIAKIHTQRAHNSKGYGRIRSEQNYNQVQLDVSHVHNSIVGN